ncbi:phage GP46 family protein [Herbaspirillum sp.]|uniref:phage GP46 family protein n=1 Tax=Herbaspirillum sp. TaxID=1890675 RepID=UPI001B0E228E|nr:phage GP46 family protein [Herbaspirillum sp.]MBO9538770.1 baseplate assembly protein [Herbaspirillum sp.]
MLKMVPLGQNQFDLAPFDESVDDDNTEAATVIYAVLYSDGVAPADRVPDRYERRGWFEDGKVGTGLWYVRRQPLNSKARSEALNMVKTALMAHSDALTEVNVDEVTIPEPAGNISSVFMDITGLHNGRQFIVRVPL